MLNTAEIADAAKALDDAEKNQSRPAFSPSNIPE